jgi:predicted acetyltransferase
MATPPHLTSPPSGSARLSEPTLAVHTSFLQALGEYHEEGLHLDISAEELTDPGSFLAWVQKLRHAGMDGEAGCSRDRVPHRVLWWTVGDNYLGRVRINLVLNDELRDFGGHIGYDIRPSARNKGHATALLADALRLAKRLHIDSALLTCAPSNAASRRVIERNGGELRDMSPSGRLRYWCPTG